MSKRVYVPKVYEPLCNKHIRFYLIDTRRTIFDDYLCEKQFRAVEKAFDKLKESDRKLLYDIMPLNEKRDLQDSYIERKLTGRGFPGRKKQKFYQMLRGVQRDIAIQLGYIPDREAQIEWECNW